LTRSPKKSLSRPMAQIFPLYFFWVILQSKCGFCFFFNRQFLILSGCKIIWIYYHI
jgi:hypothetical protein